VHRATEWDHFEKSVGTKMDRDLPSALEVASKAFERIRYSYEGGNEGVGYTCKTFRGFSGASSWRSIQNGRRSFGESIKSYRQSPITEEEDESYRH
jgi:hypothetical protein